MSVIIASKALWFTESSKTNEAYFPCTIGFCDLISLYFTLVYISSPFQEWDKFLRWSRKWKNQISATCCFIRRPARNWADCYCRSSFKESQFEAVGDQQTFKVSLEYQLVLFYAELTWIEPHFVTSFRHRKLQEERRATRVCAWYNTWCNELEKYRYFHIFRLHRYKVIYFYDG